MKPLMWFKFNGFNEVVVGVLQVINRVLPYVCDMHFSSGPA